MAPVVPCGLARPARAAAWGGGGGVRPIPTAGPWSRPAGLSRSIGPRPRRESTLCDARTGCAARSAPPPSLPRRPSRAGTAERELRSGGDHRERGPKPGLHSRGLQRKQKPEERNLGLLQERPRTLQARPRASFTPLPLPSEEIRGCPIPAPTSPVALPPLSPRTPCWGAA